MSTERKVAVITGASQGIGEGIVRGYRAAGWRVLANSRSIAPSSDPDLVTIAGDISSPKVAEKVVAAAVERFGRIDTLVNNAGIFTSKPFIEFTAEDWAANIGTNLTGFFYVTQHALRRMEAQGAGHVVNITASGGVEQPMANAGATLAAVTKGGLNAVTRALAIEYAQRGIRVNAVAPGVIKTPMHAPETLGFLAGMHPVGRMGEVSEIAEAVLFLENAAFVTGEILHVDGGQNAGRW